MNLNFITTLDAVLRTGSFANAATERHLSPSAVSLQMRRLEEYFGQALFDRSSQHVRATAFAYEVRDTFAHTLLQAERLRQRDAHALEGDVRLGVTESMQALILPSILPALKARHPGLRVGPVKGSSRSLIDQVRRNLIDCAVVIQPADGGSRRLRWTLLLQEPLILITPPGATETTVDALLSRYELIRFDSQTSAGRLGARYLAAQGLRARGEIELQSVPAILALVSAGLGISLALIPDRRLCLSYPVRRLDLGPEGPHLQVALVAQPQQDDNRRIQAVKHAVIDVLSSHSGSAHRPMA